MALMSEKVVLAFSGGLDTSFCAVYLSKVLGLEVHAVTVNTGGFTDEDIQKLEVHARALGVSHFACIDETKRYYDSCIRYLIAGNVLKNNTYPLSVSAERVSQASAIARYVQETGATKVAHGSTGAGNDQVRFDMIFNILIPEVDIITPIRDLKLSREEEIEFLRTHGAEMDFAKAAYSVNKGLWGTSVGGRETLTSRHPLPEDAYPTQLIRKDRESVEITFAEGHPVGLNGRNYDHPVELIQELERLAGEFAIGRDIHVGDTVIGIKGRVGFEAAAALIILRAHQALEKHVLSKYEMLIKDQLADWYGLWLHEGQFFDPVMRDIESFLDSSQRCVNGSVYVTLAPYRFTIDGISSPHDLMSPEFGHYGEMNKAWTGDDVKGFAKIFGNATAIHFRVNERVSKP